MLRVTLLLLTICCVFILQSFIKYPPQEVKVANPKEKCSHTYKFSNDLCAKLVTNRVRRY